MKKQRFRVIEGGLQAKRKIGGIIILASPENEPPFMVDAVVFEEDTFLIMTPPINNIIFREEHPIRMMTKLIETKPYEPGTVIVNRGQPLKILAIVHDVDQDPTWRDEWVEGAIHGIFRESERRDIRSISMPMLGTVFGKMHTMRFMEILISVITKIMPKRPERIWLRVPRGAAKRLMCIIDELLEGDVL